MTKTVQTANGFFIELFLSFEFVVAHIKPFATANGSDVTVFVQYQNAYECRQIFRRLNQRPNA